jgi:hypothetical protein
MKMRIKWKYALPAILLQKPPTPNGIKAKDLKAIAGRRMRQYEAGNWKGLVEEYEQDIIITQGMHHDNQSNDSKEMSKIRKAGDLIGRFQLGKARRHLQSNGLGYHTDDNIIQQLDRKHPTRKEAMTPLTEEELNVPRKGISKEVFDRELIALKHDVAPGLGCLQNEHIIAIKINPKRQVTPSAADAMENFYEYSNGIVQLRLPEYIYTMWVAGRMVPANKENPNDVRPGAVPDCRPVNIGNAERRILMMTSRIHISISLERSRMDVEYQEEYPLRPLKYKWH